MFSAAASASSNRPQQESPTKNTAGNKDNMAFDKSAVSDDVFIGVAAGGFCFILCIVGVLRWRRCCCFKKQNRPWRHSSAISQDTAVLAFPENSSLAPESTTVSVLESAQGSASHRDVPVGILELQPNPANHLTIHNDLRPLMLEAAAAAAPVRASVSA